MRNIVLTPARSLKGVLLGPDGNPLTGVNAMGLKSWTSYELLTSGEFMVTRLAPGRTRELVFEHKGKRLGMLVAVSGDHTDALTVRLEPYGSVTGRLVDKEGKPVAGSRAQMGRFGFVGPDLPEKTDRDGRFRAGELIPGQKYWVSGFREETFWHVEFTAEAAKEKDLGDVRPFKRSE